MKLLILLMSWSFSWATVAMEVPNIGILYVMYTEPEGFTAFTNGISPLGQNGDLIAHATGRSCAPPIQDNGSRYIHT